MSPAELKAIIARLGLSQVRVARLIGVQDRALRHWIAGDYPTPEIVARVLRAADDGCISLEWLADYASQENDQ